MKREFLYNNKALRDRRRELRNDQTEEEKILWAKLKGKQIKEQRFLRQYGIGPYILDFYCADARLAIELDGSQHREKEAVLYDSERSAYLEALDIRVLRFWNYEVHDDLSEVLIKIKNAIEETPS